MYPRYIECGHCSDRNLQILVACILKIISIRMKYKYLINYDKHYTEKF